MFSALSLRGAKRRSNPVFAQALDCFALLAMTGWSTLSTSWISNVFIVEKKFRKGVDRDNSVLYITIHHTVINDAT